MAKKNTERCTTEEIFQVMLVLKDVCEPLPADEWPDPDRKCFRFKSPDHFQGWNDVANEVMLRLGYDATQMAAQQSKIKSRAETSGRELYGLMVDARGARLHTKASTETVSSAEFAQLKAKVARLEAVVQRMASDLGII